MERKHNLKQNYYIEIVALVKMAHIFYLKNIGLIYVFYLFKNFYAQTESF